jgi:hypothetical protein
MDQQALPNLLYRKKTQKVIQSLSEPKAHFTGGAPHPQYGHNGLLKTTLPPVHPASQQHKQLDFSSILHLNFKILETVNIELSALKLILCLFQQSKLPDLKAEI